MTHQQAIEKHAAERYLLDEMPELERFAFEEHLFGCQECAEDVRTGALMQEGVAAGLLPAVAEHPSQNLEPGTNPEPGTRNLEPGTRPPEPGTRPPEPGTRPPEAGTRNPEPGPPPVQRWHQTLPWAVAAMLAVTVGYQTLWLVPALRDQVVGPMVLSPVTLRGATRGSGPTLTRPTTGVLSLAVDLAGVAAGARLTYDLRAADGTSVASGTAAAPPPGTPLLLLIPASALDSAGRYVLSMGTGDGPGSASTDYTFIITNP